MPGGFAESLCGVEASVSQDTQACKAGSASTGRCCRARVRSDSLCSSATWGASPRGQGCSEDHVSAACGPALLAGKPWAPVRCGYHKTITNPDSNMAGVGSAPERPGEWKGEMGLEPVARMKGPGFAGGRGLESEGEWGRSTGCKARTEPGGGTECLAAAQTDIPATRELLPTEGRPWKGPGRVR